jgi:fluoride exporter
VTAWAMEAGEWLFALVTGKVFLLTVGGALGTNLRYFLGKWIDDTAASRDFPLGTFVINISGSLLVALTAVFFPRGLTKTTDQWFLFLGVGFCGGYTTFSAFELQIFQLLDQGKWLVAIAYIVSSIVAGFLAVAAVYWTWKQQAP